MIDYYQDNIWYCGQVLFGVFSIVTDLIQQSSFFAKIVNNLKIINK